MGNRVSCACFMNYVNIIKCVHLLMSQHSLIVKICKAGITFSARSIPSMKASSREPATSRVKGQAQSMPVQLILWSYNPYTPASRATMIKLMFSWSNMFRTVWLAFGQWSIVHNESRKCTGADTTEADIQWRCTTNSGHGLLTAAVTTANINISLLWRCDRDT